MKTFRILILCLLFTSNLVAAPAPKRKPFVPKYTLFVSKEYQELHQELDRLPSEKICYMWIKASDEHLHWIIKRVSLFPHEKNQWQEYYQQVMDWRSLWIMLWEAQNGHSWDSDPYPTTYSIKERWFRLNYVQKAIGSYCYFAGYVPPPIAGHMLFRCD